MNKPLLLKEIDGIQYYSYKPSFLYLYYPCYSGDEIPPYFSRFIHHIRMIREIYKSHYQVIYISVNGKIIGHVVVGRGGSRIALSKTSDIVIGPVWIVPAERSHGYASKAIHFVLNELNLIYNFAYEFIDKDNMASIRTVKNNGFEFIAQCSEYGFFRIVRPSQNGHLNLYRFSNYRN